MAFHRTCCRRLDSTDFAGTIMHVIDSLRSGGTERTLVSLLRAFDCNRFRHIVVTLRGAGALAKGLPGHTACHALHARGKTCRTGVQLARVAREVGAALIHARNTGCWFDATVARFLNPRVRLVLGFHGAETTSSFSRRLHRKVRIALLSGAHFTSVSEAGRCRLRDEVGVPAHRIDVLANGVDAQRFSDIDMISRREARAAWKLDPGDLVFGTVGSLTPIKRHSALVDALSRASESLPNSKLLIVGEGALRAALIEQARASGIADRVVLTGSCEDMPAVFRCMDVYVCSSAAEGMSNALLEAMAAGLPIITTDVGDHASVVREGLEGRIVSPDSVQALGQALLDVGSNLERRRTWGAAARQRVCAFGFDRTVQSYEAFYGRMCSGGL